MAERKTILVKGVNDRCVYCGNKIREYDHQLRFWYNQHRWYMLCSVKCSLEYVKGLNDRLKEKIMRSLEPAFGYTYNED